MPLVVEVVSCGVEVAVLLFLGQSLSTKKLGSSTEQSRGFPRRSTGAAFGNSIQNLERLKPAMLLLLKSADITQVFTPLLYGTLVSWRRAQLSRPNLTFSMQPDATSTCITQQKKDKTCILRVMMYYKFLVNFIMYFPAQTF
jgi:hypothetical protein